MMKKTDWGKICKNKFFNKIFIFSSNYLNWKQFYDDGQNAQISQSNNKFRNIIRRSNRNMAKVNHRSVEFRRSKDKFFLPDLKQKIDNSSGIEYLRNKGEERREKAMIYDVLDLNFKKRENLELPDPKTTKKNFFLSKKEKDLNLRIGGGYLSGHGPLSTLPEIYNTGNAKFFNFLANSSYGKNLPVIF